LQESRSPPAQALFLLDRRYTPGKPTVSLSFFFFSMADSALPAAKRRKGVAMLWRAREMFRSTSFFLSFLFLLLVLMRSSFSIAE